ARAGEPLRHQLEVRTQEDRSVYALATSNQPWLKVECPTPKGRAAPIWLIVPAAPNQPGEQVHARINVEANGQQRFVVRVTLAIRANRSAAPVARGVAELARVRRHPNSADFGYDVGALPLPSYS